jgi:hypothetical protein
MIRDLQYPDDARHVIDSLHSGLRYDATVAVLGLAAAKCPLSGSTPDFSVGVRYGGHAEDEAVRRDAPGLLARFSVISMVSRLERHAQLLLLQRRVLEYLGGSTKKMDAPGMWKILRRVHSESWGGPVKLCSELVVEKPSEALLSRMKWLEGIVKVRNCLAHRLGQVQMEDVKRPEISIEEMKDDDTLKAVWLRIKATLGGKEIEAFPHVGGGNLTVQSEEYEREWRIGDQIEVTPLECQGIAMSLSFLGNQLLADFEREMNALLGLSAKVHPPTT